MLRLLLAVDGSPSSLAAARFVANLAGGLPAVELHLLNVQPPLPAAAADFLPADVVRDYHRDESDGALKEAQAILDQAGLRYERHAVVGDAAHAIAEHAAQRQCDQIVMGTRGLGRIEGLLLGSVAAKVLHLVRIPVTLVK